MGRKSLCRTRSIEKIREGNEIKQGKIIMAIKTLDKLKSQQMALSLSYRIYKLRKELQPHWDWQVEQEMQMMEKYGEPNETGVTIKQEARADFDSALALIVDTEVEQDWNPVEIAVNEDLMISVEDIEALDGFITIGVLSE